MSGPLVFLCTTSEVRSEATLLNFQAVAIEPVLQIVRAGKARNLPIAVASAGTRKHVLKSLDEAGIADLFDAVVCGGKESGSVFMCVRMGTEGRTSDEHR